MGKLREVKLDDAYYMLSDLCNWYERWDTRSEAWAMCGHRVSDLLNEMLVEMTTRKMNINE